jgi:hypothetical protein
MKTKSLHVAKSHALKPFASVVGVAWLAVAPVVASDVIFSPPVRLAGLYKITSSSDPVFPVSKTRECFLDFGEGIQSGKFSGSVAISVRVNPNVKVRIFSWQYFPDQGQLLIGRPFAHGSRNAVAIGAWQMKGLSDGVVFVRGNHQVVLRRPEPGDY